MIKILATHKTPDLDAVTSIWLLQRFDAEKTAHATLAFVNPGETLSVQEAAQMGAHPHEVIHVDTGLGEFDHHQPDRGKQYLSASLVIYNYLCQQHPNLTSDQALQQLVEHVTDVDQFAQVHWPESATRRSRFALDELLSGLPLLPNMTDEHIVHLGKELLDSAYASMEKFIQAETELQLAQRIELTTGYCIGVETSNDYCIDVAQLKGATLVVKKDPKEGNIRIKARPDSSLSLTALRDMVLEADSVGVWYLHPSDKMLLNGSSKRPGQKPSPLTLKQVLEMVQECYGA